MTIVTKIHINISEFLLIKLQRCVMIHLSTNLSTNSYLEYNIFNLKLWHKFMKHLICAIIFTLDIILVLLIL